MRPAFLSVTFVAALLLTFAPTSAHAQATAAPEKAKTSAKAKAKARRDPPRGLDLQLMSAVKNVSGIPKEGKNLAIVANVGDVLHFRFFDVDGKVVVDKEETDLTTQALPIEGLKEELEKLWPPHQLTEEEKNRIIPAVASIVSQAPPGFYKGRRIAAVMSFEGAEWLVRASREQEEQPDAMIDALKIKPGQTVADVGAGVGYTSVRLARRVGLEGKVLATDLQPEMLRMMAQNVKAAGLKNVTLIRATPLDTQLPENAVDLILMVDVYHECPYPEFTLRGLRRALKPGGRLVLVEFRGEDPEVPIKPEHKMTVEQAKLEVVPQGFVFKESLEFLPWQHVIIFEKPAQDAEKPAAKDADKN